MVELTRQQRRAAERRATKPDPAPIELSSRRWIGRRTKGMPFSRLMLREVIANGYGRPATLVLKHPTRKTVHARKASSTLLAVFFPSIPENLRQAMLGIG